MKIVFGNLKMNFLYRDFQNYLEEIRILMEKETPKVALGIAVPYIYLREAAAKVGTSIKIMAQDLHASDFGAFTSHISAPQIASLEVPATIIGHSECRAGSQNSLVITNKVKAALSHGLEVIYCCGADPVAEISEELKSLTEEEWKKVIIAYEPISAIGTGQAMGASSAAEVINKIRKVIGDTWGKEISDNVKVLYGGSVKVDNYKEYLNFDSIDGVLVGGASLKVDEFWKMATLQ